MKTRHDHLRRLLAVASMVLLPGILSVAAATKKPARRSATESVRATPTPRKPLIRVRETPTPVPQPTIAATIQPQPTVGPTSQPQPTVGPASPAAPAATPTPQGASIPIVHSSAPVVEKPARRGAKAGAGALKSETDRGEPARGKKTGWKAAKGDRKKNTSEIVAEEGLSPKTTGGRKPAANTSKADDEEKNSASTTGRRSGTTDEKSATTGSGTSRKVATSKTKNGMRSTTATVGEATGGGRERALNPPGRTIEPARVVDDSPVARSVSLAVGLKRVVTLRQRVLAVVSRTTDIVEASTSGMRGVLLTGRAVGETTVAIFTAQRPDDEVGVANIYRVIVLPADAVVSRPPRPSVAEVPKEDPGQSPPTAKTDNRASSGTTATTALGTVPGAIGQQIRFDLELVPIADTRTSSSPEENIWIISGLPMTAFKSLESVTLREWIATLPQGSVIAWQQPPNVGMMQAAIKAHNAEFADFSVYCAGKGIWCGIDVRGLPGK